MAHDVFVSYPSDDKPTADTIVHALESQDVRCWYAPRDIAPGTEWAASIIQAIRDSQAMVLVLSDAANNSDHILREIRQAADLGLPILPVRTTAKEPNESLQYYLGGTHWLDAITPPLEEHLGKLADTVRRVLGDDTPPAIDGQLPAPQISPPDRPPSRRPSFWAVVVGIATAVAAMAITLSMLLSDSNEGPAATETADPATAAPGTTSAAIETADPAATAPGTTSFEGVGPDTAFEITEDFEGDVQAWEAGFLSNGVAGSVDGGYVVSANDDKFLMWGISPYDLAEVTIEVTAEPIAGDNLGRFSYGVLCRATQTDYLGGYWFAVTGEGAYQVAWYGPGGDFIDLNDQAREDRYDDASVLSAAVNRGLNENQFRVTCSGSDLSLTVNGVPVWTGSDDNLTVGRIALGAFSYGGEPVTVRFDDLRLASVREGGGS